MYVYLALFERKSKKLLFGLIQRDWFLPKFDV